MTKVNYINILGNEIAYHRENTGKPTVLFVHGFNSNLEFTKNLWDNPYFDVIALDLPGNGKSKTDKRITVELFQNTTQEFIKKMDLKNIIVFGHSLGAASATFVSSMKEVKQTLLMCPYNPFLITYAADYLSPANLKNASGTNIKEKAQNFLHFAVHPKEKFKFMMTSQVLKKSYMENEIYKLYKANAKNIEVLASKTDHVIIPKTIEHMELTLGIKTHWLNHGRHNPINEHPNDVMAFIRQYLPLLEKESNDK